ncbi:unnamed protein product [Chrysodeixis includens]|uniref:Uncharacterized protein n=1 Tax=Chrysodeixis includens TaxID=689277 RepID=A0A9P0FVP5_CHRIL|nr:unnamed protein product [Chrysodeixis includens]
MKFFVAFVALVAVAVASPLVKPVSSDIEALEAIVAAINSPSTDPATAALLEQQLQEVLGSLDLHPISVGPAIIMPEPIAVGPAISPEPISIGPAIVDFPLPEGALGEAPIVAPSPVAIVEGPAPVSDSSSAPLVQIILNINQASAEAVPVGPVGPVIAPTPVQVVDAAPIPVEPVQVVEIAPEPVQVVEVAPVPVEPVLIGMPIIPSPAITLPEELN